MFAERGKLHGSFFFEKKGGVGGRGGGGGGARPTPSIFVRPSIIAGRKNIMSSPCLQ